MSTSLKGRALAIIAGCAFAAGGLTILLGKDLLHPLDWVATQWITILTVFGTIAAGHLLHDAGFKHPLAATGFLLLFVSGTCLVVCQSSRPPSRDVRNKHAIGGSHQHGHCR